MKIKTDIEKEYLEAEETHREEHGLSELVMNYGELTEQNLEGKIKDKINQWYMNSRVIEGRYIGRYRELAEYLSDKFNCEVTEDDVHKYKTGLQKSIHRNLSDADKIQIVQEQVSLVFHQASVDRGKAVALQETLEMAIQDLIKMFDGDASSAFLSKGGKSLLFFLQTQQKISQEANDRVLVVLEKMLGFGTTRDANDTLYRLLNAGDEGSKPLTGADVMKLLEDTDKNGVLPTTAGQAQLKYEDFDKEFENECRTITVDAERVQETEENESKLDSSGSNSFGSDQIWPD